MPSALLSGFMLLVSGCAGTSEDAPVPDGTHINTIHMAAIQEQLGTQRAGYAFAVLADSHTHYEELKHVLDHIAADTSLKFVLVCGDITDDGTARQLKDYVEVMQQLERPFITLIGNRDHAGSGRIGFEELFGARNDQFVAGGVRFILFDNVVKESDLAVDFNWLKTALAAPHDGPTILAMHIQPTDPTQLTQEHMEKLNALIAEHKPAHVFMGHNHAFRQREFPDGTPYTTVSWPKGGEYVKVVVSSDRIVPHLVRLPAPSQENVRAPAPPSQP